MTQVYGPEFETGFMSSTPNKAKTYVSLKEALLTYQCFLDTCERYGQTPNDAWLFIGTPDGDEQDYGYPDYPDYILEPMMNTSGEYRARLHKA